METCNAELVAFLCQRLHALENDRLQPCTGWEENIRKWVEKTAVLGSMFSEIAFGNGQVQVLWGSRSDSCSFQASQACSVWLGEWGSLLIFFTNNKNFPRGCSSRCSMLHASHMRSKTGFAALVFNQNCWLRAWEILSGCLFLENFLSTSRVVSRACL